MICFLDIDGVLNSQAFFDAAPARSEGQKTRRVTGASAIDPVATQRLNRLVEAGCRFVLSSSWRYPYRDKMPEFRQILRTRGFNGKLIGRTPTTGELKGTLGPYHLPVHIPRGHEIQEWLDANPTEWSHRDQIVILDDYADMEPLEDRLVRTNDEVGLTDSDVERALALLRR
jgi:hypothetical protein